MKIKSLVDVITNSSSECYIIKNPKICLSDFQELWENKLIKEGYYDEQMRPTEKTDYEDYIHGELSEDENGNFRLDFPILCNLDFDVDEILREWFGTNNVDILY